MRIAHVLSYVSSDGSYGGPVAVAGGQCRALAARGHEVTLFAGWDGHAQLTIPGVDVRLHRARRVPGLGFAGLFAPPLWWDLRRHLSEFDVIHFHVARDLVQLPAAALSVGRVRSYLQPHGMIRPDLRMTARILDRVLTRPVMKRASAILTLTEQEHRDMATMAPMPRRVRIRNGVSLPELRARWTHPAAVLFLARLHPRKRPLEFIRMAALVREARPETSFLLVGADEGQAPAVRAEISRLGLDAAVTYEGPVSPQRVGSIMRGAQVYVLPSVDEPFPMAVLEAMAHGLPSVITTETGISQELALRGSAEVSRPDARSLADAVLTLLSEERWMERSRIARRDIELHFSLDAVVDALQWEYER